MITEATTLGTFVAFMAYQMRLLFPVQALMGLYANLASARASLVRVHELWDTPLDVEEAEGAERLERAVGALVLEDVRLGFGRGGEVLEGVSLEVPAGQVVALVGASGSGKSTIADLLSRQLDPDGGRVLLDGRDVRELVLEDVRRNVAVVEQDPFIFHASIAENVRYARPGATDPEVAGALAAAALGIGPDRLARDMRSLGLLFESLVVRDLRVYCQAGDIAVFHHQAQRGGELDAVLEARDGRWVAVEVKLGGNEQMLDQAAAKLLAATRGIDTSRRLPPAAHLIVTAFGTAAYQRPDGVTVAPITALGP